MHENDEEKVYSPHFLIFFSNKVLEKKEVVRKGTKKKVFFLLGSVGGEVLYGH